MLFVFRVVSVGHLSGHAGSTIHQSERPQMTARSYRFSHAITRRPAASIVQGLRAVDRGAPSLALMARQQAE